MAASQSLTVPKIPAGLSIETFTKCICDLKLPCLIDYSGTITGQQVSEFLQQKFNDEKSIKIDISPVFGNTYCVKGSIDETRVIPDNVKLPTTSCIVQYKEPKGFETFNNGIKRMSNDGRHIVEHVFNDYWFVPQVPLTKTTSNLIEKYILITEKTKGVYYPSGGQFYPDIDAITSTINEDGQLYVLKIKFDPKTDMKKFPPISQTHNPVHPECDLILPSYKEETDCERILDTTKMSTCLDGHIEKFVLVSRNNRSGKKYGINNSSFNSKDNMQKILVQNAPVEIIVLKIMFRIEDISTVKTSKKPVGEYYMEFD